MRRARRNTPLWIVLGAAGVIFGATYMTNAGRGSAAKSVPVDVAAKETPAPVEVAPAAPAPVPTLGNPRRTAPAEPAFEASEIPSALTPADATPPSSEPVGAAGMVVGIDPETGKLGMPSREFRDALLESDRSPALSRSMEGLQVIHRPDGSKMIDLKGRFQEYTVVRIAPDGRKEQFCVQGADVEATLQGKANATPSDPEAAAPTAADPEAAEPSADPGPTTASNSQER